MEKPCRPIIKLTDGTLLDLNGKTDAELKQLMLSSPGFFKYYQRYLQEIEVIDKELDRSVVHDPVLMTGNKYTSEADKKKALNEQKESKPVFVHTVDRFYFNSGNKLETVEIDDNNQDAPTVKLHKEGMEYINSPFFKPGTAIFYGFSNAIPYNKRLPTSDKINGGRLSALVFTDKFDNALSAEEVQIKESNLPELVKNGEVKIKWVGSLYEYNNEKYEKEAQSLTYKSTQILTNRFRARRYKEKLLQKPAIALPGFNLHLDTHIYEQMHETVGFNENIDFIQPDPNGPIKELLKNVTSLTYIYGYPKVGIFTGFQKGTDGYPTQMQIPALDGKTIPISHSVFKNFKNLVKATGRAYLLVPTSINNAIEDNQGNKYALSRLVTKALNYDANPNDTSDASTIILTIMNSMMAKVLDGSINYDIDRSDPKEPIIINYKDNTVRKVSKVKIHDDGSIKMLVDLFKNTQLYQDYTAQETGEVTDYKFYEYLKEVDPEIPGIYKYASLYSNELVWMPEYLRQVLGMQVVKQDDLISILQLWKNMQQEGIPRAEAWQKFLREWGAAGKPIQVDVGQLANPLYWERWLKPYALLKTGLNVDRPTHSVSFYTSPVEKQEKTFNEDNTVGSNPFELFNDLNQNVYSSTFDDGPKMTKEEVIAWVNRNFPNVKKLNFYEGLIDELYNGAYNKVSDDIRYAEEFMTLGVIREEFGHKVFNSLPESQKQDLLKEARKLRPDITDDIALEEIIMKQLRESPNSVRPKTFLSQFLTKLKQLLEAIFKKRLDIEEFISRFDAGYYKSIKDKNINNPDLREKVSVLTSKLSKQSLKKYSDIVNRYVLQKYVGQSDLISIIDEQQKFLDTNVNGALKFIYNKVLPLYIEKEQEYAKEKIFAEYPALAEGFTFEKLQNSVGLFKPGTEAYYYAMYYAEFEIAKKLLEEPLFQVQLYKDLKETYGIEIRGTIEDAEKDKLGIVKAKDIKLSEEVSPSLKYLLAMIPDVSWIEDAAFKANRNKLSKETGMIAAKTAIEAIPGVVYKNTLYNNKIDDKSIPTNKIYSYNFTVNQRIASLGSVLSDSMTPRELITKLNDLYDNGDDWQRVFAFKILEEFEIMGNASPLIKDLWRGIGQKSFIPVFASYDKEGDKKTYSLNVVNTKDRLLTGFLKSAKYFGMAGTQVISITDPAKERALKERLQTINKKIQERPSKAKEVSLLVEGFSLLNIYVTKKDLNKISGNNKRDTLRDIFKRIVRDIAFPNDKLNVGLGLMFQNIGLPDAKGPLNDLAQLISLSNEKSKVLTYNDMNNETRNSYSKPNMLLTHLRRLFRDKDYAALVRTYTGYEHNPLLKAFQQALTSGTNPFDLFVYMGDRATNTNYDDMTTAQRNAFHMNNAAQGAKNDTNKWGYFSLGNWGNSPTDYSLKAPILAKSTILSNFVDLIRAEVEVLLSGAEKYDSTFAANFGKGIYNFDVNDLVFGNIERIPANLNLVLANINANEDAIMYSIKQHIKPGVSELFESNPELANSVYEALGFKTKQENVSEIYSKLGSKTKEGNVIIQSVYQTAGVQYAKSIGGVFSLRVNNTSKHFGNPFSPVSSEIAKGLVSTSTIKEAVENYIDWVLNVDTFKIKNLFTVEPRVSADKKAKVKASIATQYIGFGEGIRNSSTELYRQQAGKFANTGKYSWKDTIFVSVGGNRGDAVTQKTQQDRTIKEALKAIETGAVLLTDNKEYIDANSYDVGEKRLAQNLNAKGYNYTEVTINNTLLGVWYKGELNPVRNKWIKEQLKSGALKNKPIVYYKELGEPSHATALDYLINKYDWNQNVNTETNNQFTQEGNVVEGAIAAANFGKGIYNFDVNDLVFGNIERIPANLNLVLANINANEDAIKKVITEDLAKRQEKFIQDLKDQDVYNASKLHSYYHKDESTYDQFSNVTEIEISPSKVSVYFWNNNYYQMASNQLLLSHPHFFKDSNTYAKRAKLLHTSGDIPWDVYDENTQLKTKLRYIVLKDKVTAVDQEVLDLISEKAFSNTKEASLKDFTENKGTDSGAFMSMDMLKMRNNEGKGWNYYDEQYYRAQMDLDVENIMRYQSKVSWNPLKLGAYSLREEIGETGKLVIIPTIQKYAFQILLPSEIYKLKDGTLIHPDKVEGKTLREKYAKYQNPELVKLLHSNFEKGVHFGYYGSGGKSGIIDLHDLSKDAAPKINQMPITDIKEVTKQPNKNDTKSRVLGIQARMIQYGMIEDTDSFTISNYGTISGARAKELLEEAYANDIYDKLKEIGFLAKDFYNNYQVKKEELSTYIKDYLMSKDYINPQQIRALDLSPDKKDFAVPLSLGNRPGAAMSIVNAAVNEVLQIEVNAPAYKNITRTGDLKTFVSTENGQKGMVMEAKVNMWPALERYYHKKLRENNIADKDQVGQERIKKEIIDEINGTGFKMTYYRIPTEFGYSFMRIKIKDLGPASLGNGIELPDSFTTQTGGDLDGDAVFGLISSLQFGDSITLVPADTTSKGGRQTLINEIMDATLHAHPEYQLISSENNTFNDITKAIPVKQSKIGTLEANIEAQESNDLGDSLIGPLAVENSAIWYLHGLRDKLNLSTVRKHPAFDKAYSNNLLEYMVEGDLTKMAQSTTLVGGAVNNPKDGGFTKLGFDKKTGSLLGYMTSVMTVPMDYAIAFLRHPVIKEYRKAVSKIGTFASNPNYNSDLNKIKRSMYGDKYASDWDITRIITKEELKSNDSAIRKAILGKYIELSTISGNIVKLYLALGQLKKPNDGNPENLFALYEDLQVLPKHFVGIEKLLPQIVLNTKSGNTVFEKKNPSIANDLNASYQAIIAKMSIARETSYFFHEKFKNFWNWSKANIWGLQAKDAVELENLFFRYMLSRQFKPLLEYMHLGEIVHTPEQANDMVTRQQFSLQFMQNKLYSLINTEGLDSKDDLMKMIYTLSFLDNAKNPINYRADDGTIKRNYYVKMATSIYDEEDIQSFNEGFMAMLNSKDPQIKKFAKDLRDFTVFTGWDKKDNNFGGYLPREAWLVDYVDYNQGMKVAYDNIDGELFLRTVTLYNPKRYSPQIFNTPFTMDGKKYWPFKYIKNSAPAQLTGENRYVTDKELGGKIAIPMKFYIDKELNEEYLIDKELEIGPRYIHERQGDYVGLYKRLPESRTKYTLLSVSKDSQIMDSSPNSILALTLDDVHEELPDQGITIDPINPEIEEQPNQIVVEDPRSLPLEQRKQRAIPIITQKLQEQNASEEEIQSWIDKVNSLNSMEEMDNFAAELTAKCK